MILRKGLHARLTVIEPLANKLDMQDMAIHTKDLMNTFSHGIRRQITNKDGTSIGSTSLWGIHDGGGA